MRPETNAQERLRAIAEERRRTKQCARCWQVKPRAEFGVSSRTKDGLSSWCKACRVEHTRQWRAEHREEINARRRLAPVTRTCPGCGTEFTGRPNKLHCSKRCQRRAKDRRRDHRRRETR